MEKRWYQKASVQASIVGGVFVLLAAVVYGVFNMRETKPDIPKQPPAVEETPTLTDQELVARLMHLAQILERNYAEQILDDVTFWESEGLSKSQILEQILVELKDTVQNLENIHEDMNSTEYKDSEFGKGIAEQMKFASTYAKIAYQELLGEAQKILDRRRTNAEVIAHLVEKIMEMKQYDIESFDRELN